MNANELRIKELHDEIWRLEAEERDKNIAKVLPFLQDNIICEFKGCSGLEIILNQEQSDTERQLIDYIAGKENQDYHCGCTISEIAEIRYDDGHLHVRFTVNGNTALMQKTILIECKRLKLKLSFKNLKEDREKAVERYTSMLNETIELENFYNSLR